MHPVFYLATLYNKLPKTDNKNIFKGQENRNHFIYFRDNLIRKMVTWVWEGLREQKGNGEVSQILVIIGKSYNLQGWGTKERGLLPCSPQWTGEIAWLYLDLDKGTRHWYCNRGKKYPNQSMNTKKSARWG